MAALAVDQDKRLIRIKPTQRCRANNVGAISDRRLRKVEARDLFGKQAVGFGKARLGQRFRREHINRHGAIGNGAVGTAGTCNDNRFFSGCGTLLSVLREGGR